MKNEINPPRKGEQAVDAFGVTVEIVSYSELMHAVTIRYADGSEKWTAAETVEVLR